jgi:nicotinic acid mononucleotide adenylyltransferase
VGILTGPPDDVSSTLIRDRIRRDLPVSELVPHAVEEYIHKNGLYAAPPGGHEA